MVSIFWYLLFESDDFTTLEQVIECETGNRVVAYPAFATDTKSAIARLKKQCPYLQYYFLDNLLNSFDSFIENIEAIDSEHLAIEAKDISMMHEEPRHFANKLAAILIRLHMVCSDEEIEYERKDLTRAVLDAELRSEEEGVSLYREKDEKLTAARLYL